MKVKEKEMYEPIKRWLIEKVDCNKVYGEILNHDVLALHGSCNIIVEMKTSLTLSLLRQAYYAIERAEYVYIAIPKKRGWKEYKFVETIFLDQHKIGVLEVDMETKLVRVKKQAGFQRHAKRRGYDLRKYIKEYSHLNAGGITTKEKVTEYSVTIGQIEKYLKRQKQALGQSNLFGEMTDSAYKWVTVDEILQHCETHYMSPKPSVMQTLQAKWNRDWVESKKQNGKRYFRYKYSEGEELNSHE